MRVLGFAGGRSPVYPGSTARYHENAIVGEDLTANSAVLIGISPPSVNGRALYCP
jgi:hypothetical protein